MSALPPSLVNVPNRDYWLVPERMAEVQRKLQRFGDWLAVGLTAFLVATLEPVLRANLTRTPLAGGVLTVMLVLLVAGQGLSIALLIRSFARPRPGEPGSRRGPS